MHTHTHTWHSLLLDYKFIAKHWLRARPLQISYQCIWEPNKQIYLQIYDENFHCLTIAGGLFLERSLTSSAFRVRNFATRQVLYLPDAQNIVAGSFMSFAFDSSTGECKVACLYSNEEDKEIIGIKVLTIGKDDEWRTLKPPYQIKSDRVLKRSFTREFPDERTAHLVETIQLGEDDLKLKVLSFDVWTECFTIHTLPQGVFSDLRKVSIFRWKNSVAVSDIVGEDLEVLVLEGFKEHKWSKTTIPLKFLKDDPVLKDQIRPFIASGDELLFENAVRKNDLVYDMKREVIIEADTLSTEKNVSSVKPSLITRKGMKWEYQGARNMSL